MSTRHGSGGPNVSDDALTPSRLRAVIAVAETGSFTTAAQRTRTSQSQVSRAVATVEQVVGTELFDRSTRSVRLTDAGREFVERIGVVAAELDAAVHAVRPTTHSAPRVVLASLTSVSELHLPTAIADLDEPIGRFRCIEGLQAAVVQAVTSGRASAGIGDLADLGDDLAGEPLWTEPFVVAVAAGHPLAGANSLALGAIAAQPLIAFSRESELRSTVDRELAAARRLRAPDIVVDRFRTALGLVAADRGVMVVPAIAGVALPDGVRVVALDEPGLRRTIGVLHRNDTPLTGPLARLIERLTAIVTRIKNVDRVSGTTSSSDPSP